MKVEIRTFATKALLILAVILNLTSVSPGQSRKAGKRAIPQKMIENLILNMKSDNDGLRRSSIYLTGKYEIEQTVSALIEQLMTEKNSDIRLLIVLSLYKIGEEKGLEAIGCLAISENDRHIRKIYEAIIEGYPATSSTFTVHSN